MPRRDTSVLIGQYYGTLNAVKQQLGAYSDRLLKARENEDLLLKTIKSQQKKYDIMKSNLETKRDEDVLGLRLREQELRFRIETDQIKLTNLDTNIKRFNKRI